MKLLIKLLVIAVIGGALILTAGYFLVPPAAKKAVDEGSRFAFGVPASIGSIGASPGLSNTSVGFEQYRLASPTGFEDPLLTIGRFKVGVATTSLIGSTKEVGEFVLEDVTLTLVQDGVQTNIVPVLKHLRGLAGGGDGGEAPAPEGGGSPGPKLKVGKIRISGVGARLKLTGIPGVGTYDESFTVPDYEQDLSSAMGEDGMTVAEIAGALVEGLKEQALGAADGKVPAELLAVLEKTLDGGLEGGVGGALGVIEDAAMDKAKELEGQAKDALEGAQDKVQDALDGAQEKAEGEVERAKSEAEKAAGDAMKGVQEEAGKTLKKGLGNLLGGDGR